MSVTPPSGADRPCPTCGVSYPLDALFCPGDGTPLAPLAVPLIGRTIGGRYHVTRELGRGGMGHVYLATQLPMKRPCALKVIRPDRGWDPASVARFHREAENASRISHTNVAQVYDSGEADGLAYLAMEFVDGEPLSALLGREGKLGPRRTARIIWQVANALGAAHYLGIVHRDLKPENVMLTKYRDWVDFVKVVDFGIAKAPVEGQQVTSASAIIGTPEYMSPEQFISGNVDARADVYALALLTIRILTGTLPPIVGPKALMQPSGIPDPLELKAMPETAAWPEPVFAALSRALARDASARTPSVDQFAVEFAEAASRWEPSDGSAEPWEGRLGTASGESRQAVQGGAPPQRRNRRPLLAGVGVLVVVGALSLLWFRSASGPAAPTSPPLLPPVAVPPAPPPVVPPSPPTEATLPDLAATEADSVSLLDRLTDPSRVTDQSARRAVSLYRRLLPTLTIPASRAAAGYYTGRGLVRLGREAEACALFRTAAGDARGSPMSEPLRALLEGCPAR